LLSTHGIDFTMHEHQPFLTVADMEEHLPFPKEAFVKTLAFKIKNSFWLLAVTRGQDRVDYRKIAAVFGISRSHILRPAPEEIEAQLGMVQGGVCPIAISNDVRVVFDEGLRGMQRIYCGGARNDRTLEIGLDDLLRVSGGQVAAIVRDE
jgi:prolyl-tRNA editing enzyme YbaK/EbsC (Cys-tRNA(Pro) deacylase)